MTPTRRQFLTGLLGLGGAGLAGCIGVPTDPSGSPGGTQQPRSVNSDGQGAGHADRTGETYRASAHASIQDALDTLSPGDTLDIDEDITGGFDVPQTNGITITSSTNATLSLPSGDSGPLISWPGWDTDDTGASPVDEGADRIDVDDPSVFEVGSDVRIIDENESYRGVGPGEMDSSVGSDLTTGEFHTVAGISGDTLQFEQAIRHPYSNESGTLQVERIDWGVNDVILSNLSFIGHESAGTLQGIDEAKNVTLENITADRWGAGSDNKIVQIETSWRVTVRGSTITTGFSDRAKGININAGSTDVLIEQCEVSDMGRYGINTGHGSGHHPTCNVSIIGCTARDCDHAGYDCHFGSEDIRFRGCTAIDCQRAHNIRGWDIDIINGTSEGISEDVLWFRQWPVDISIEGYTHNSGGNSVLDGYLETSGLTIDKLSITDSTFNDGFEFSDLDSSDVGRTSVRDTRFLGESVDDV